MELEEDDISELDTGDNSVMILLVARQGKKSYEMLREAVPKRDYGLSKHQKLFYRK